MSSDSSFIMPFMAIHDLPPYVRALLVLEPLVPEVMPKVALPEVPLVVEARKCAGVPRWPSNSMLPQPQFGPPGDSAIALRETTVKRVPRRIRFIALFSLCANQWTRVRHFIAP